MGVVQGRPAGPAALARLTSGNRNPDEALKAACAEITHQAPLILDTTTRLDSCRGETGKRVVFHLNLVHFDGAREGTAAFMQNARPVLVRGICRNPDVVMLGRTGVTLVFRYAGIGNRPVGDLTIAPGACAQA